MHWIDRIRDRLFGTNAPAAGQPHHAPLKRSAAFLEEHRAWRSGTRAPVLLRAYRTHLLDERLSGTGDLVLLNTPQAEGFQVQRPDPGDADDLRHLLDLFRDRVLMEGYRVQMSDLRISASGEQRERHYLKPEPGELRSDGRVDQRYGNVLLEAWGGSGGLSTLKVLVTVYSDRLYGAPLPASELFDTLLSDSRFDLS